MKKWIFFLMVAVPLLVPVSVVAADVVLAWDPNEPAPDGYRIFVRELDQDYDYTAPAWSGPHAVETVAGTEQVSGVVPDLVVGKTYAFVVRAYAGDLESADSNEVVYTIPTEQEIIIYPGRPALIRVIPKGL